MKFYWLNTRRENKNIFAYKSFPENQFTKEFVQMRPIFGHKFIFGGKYLRANSKTEKKRQMVSDEILLVTKYQI